MPNVDGLESTRLIRQMGYSAPIVALTAFSEESNVKECTFLVEFATRLIDCRHGLWHELFPGQADPTTRAEAGSEELLRHHPRRRPAIGQRQLMTGSCPEVCAHGSKKSRPSARSVHTYAHLSKSWYDHTTISCQKEFFLDDGEGKEFLCILHISYMPCLDLGVFSDRVRENLSGYSILIAGEARPLSKSNLGIVSAELDWSGFGFWRHRVTQVITHGCPHKQQNYQASVE